MQIDPQVVYNLRRKAFILFQLPNLELAGVAVRILGGDEMLSITGVRVKVSLLLSMVTKVDMIKL
jgi:hypothetical protein